jgi:hypothetical protein
MQNYHKYFWGEVLMIVNYLQNWNPAELNENQMTTYQIWFGHQPNLFHLQIFGCKVHVLIHKKKYKLHTHFIKCIFFFGI